MLDQDLNEYFLETYKQIIAGHIDLKAEVGIELKLANRLFAAKGKDQSCEHVPNTCLFDFPLTPSRAFAPAVSIQVLNQQSLH